MISIDSEQKKGRWICITILWWRGVAAPTASVQDETSVQSQSLARRRHRSTRVPTRGWGLGVGRRLQTVPSIHDGAALA